MRWSRISTRSQTITSRALEGVVDLEDHSLRAVLAVLFQVLATDDRERVEDILQLLTRKAEQVLRDDGVELGGRGAAQRASRRPPTCSALHNPALFVRLPIFRDLASWTRWLAKVAARTCLLPLPDLWGTPLPSF
jgi:hypothetical protein